MFGLMVNQLADQLPQGGSQCFPFYTYDTDGTNRRENITDWALVEFQTHYRDDTITKWDIFHYNYGLLYHPDYREKYEANLSKSPKTLYQQVLIPAYHISMHFRHKVPTRGTQLEEMRFYLLKDKQLILPNNLAVSLIE